MAEAARELDSVQTYRLQVVYEIDEDGIYIASCPALAGCHAQGDTYEEATANIQDVIAMCIEELRNEGESLPAPGSEVIGTRYIEVTA